jgi:mono/diheme cytochrome c family protein
MKLILTLTAFGTALLITNTGTVWAQGDAKDLYLNKCATCHGPDGTAKTAMGRKLKIKDVHAIVGSMSADAMIKIVTDGKGQDMDAYGKQFKPDQIKALVEYYRGLGK